jgi:predicted ATPase
MITQFRVQNFKALRDVKLDLTPIHVLIGPNDSGKTSILQAIEALSRSVDYRLPPAFTGAWEARELVWRQSDVAIVFGASISLGSSAYGYTLECEFGPESRNVTVTTEAVDVPGDGPYGLPHSRHDTSFFFQFVHAPSEAKLPKHEVTEIIRTCSSSLRGVHRYRWSPSMLALPVAIDPSRESRLEESGFGLAQLLDEIMNFDRKAFVELEEKFFSIFRQYDAIRLLVTGKAFRAADSGYSGAVKLDQAPGKKIVMRRIDGTEIAASQLSDGTLIVLAYLAVLYSPQPPSFLLIEEPENGIHPLRLREVVKILRDVVNEQDKTQVILTTHSPYVVDRFEPNEVTLCRMQEAGEVRVQRLIDSPLVKQQKDLFTLGEIWTLEGDEALSATASDATAT